MNYKDENVYTIISMTVFCFKDYILFHLFYTALNCNFNTMTLITDIGREIARDMASKGARLIMACKNVSKGM